MNHFKLREVEPAQLKIWVERNITPLSQIAWLAYGQGRFRERRVATNLVREVDIDIDKYTGWAFV